MQPGPRPVASSCVQKRGREAAMRAAAGTPRQPPYRRHHSSPISALRSPPPQCFYVCVYIPYMGCIYYVKYSHQPRQHTALTAATMPGAGSPFPCINTYHIYTTYIPYVHCTHHRHDVGCRQPLVCEHLAVLPARAGAVSMQNWSLDIHASRSPLPIMICCMHALAAQCVVLVPGCTG